MRFPLLRRWIAALLLRQSNPERYAEIRLHPTRHPHRPVRLVRGFDGWRVHTHDGTLCHCFADWYDECRLSPEGHAEVRKHRRDLTEVTRFRWDSEQRAYTREGDFVEKRRR